MSKKACILTTTKVRVKKECFGDMKKISIRCVEEEPEQER